MFPGTWLQSCSLWQFSRAGRHLWQGSFVLWWMKTTFDECSHTLKCERWGRWYGSVCIISNLFFVKHWCVIQTIFSEISQLYNEERVCNCHTPCWDIEEHSSRVCPDRNYLLCLKMQHLRRSVTSSKKKGRWDCVGSRRQAGKWKQFCRERTDLFPKRDQQYDQKMCHSSDRREEGTFWIMAVQVHEYSLLLSDLHDKT